VVTLKFGNIFMSWIDSLTRVVEDAYSYYIQIRNFVPNVPASSNR
jgi:hypothetical protein